MLTERESALRALPCFSTFSEEEIQELGALMVEKHYEAGETIVKENDLVDSIFIIKSGEAEVRREEKHRKRIFEVPIAILHPGETIGLNDTGFFSTTGKRTATVVAISPVDTYFLSIKDFLLFLQKHSHLQSAMSEAAGLMLRVGLIKQALPFHRLSHDRLMWLADKIEDLNIPKNTEIFKQGEVGNCCYFIVRGQVEIVSQDPEGNIHSLATLTPSTLFGEATLITHTPRNATAIALEDCELLVLHHEHLSELIESEKNVAKMFMTLMIDRSRPTKNPAVTSHPRETAEGDTVTILKNPDTGDYFKLSEQGVYVWEQLDGKQTMQEITLALADKFDVFAPDVVAALISKLAKKHFILEVEVENEGRVSGPLWVRTMLHLRRILESRVAIGDADKWITKTYNNGIYLLFSRPAQILLGLFAVIGFFAFGFGTNETITIFKTMPNSWLLILGLIPATIIQKTLHEFGHAFATKAFGYEVHYMGIGWYWLGPVGFTDTSDMWLSTRGPRTVVNLAGVFTDVLLAGLCAMLMYIIPNLYVQGFFWIFALYIYISAFRMLSPLQELDGYYLLMDLVDRAHLRHNAVIWLVKDFPKAFRHPSLFKNHWPEVIYWIACIMFLTLVSVLTYLLQDFIFKIFNFNASNLLVSLALPFFVVLVSSLTIIADLRSQAE